MKYELVVKTIISSGGKSMHCKINEGVLPENYGMVKTAL